MALQEFEEWRMSSFDTEGMQMVHGEIEALMEKQSHAGGAFLGVLKTEHALAVEDKGEEQLQTEVLEALIDSDREDHMEQLEGRLAAMLAAAVDTRAQEWNTCTEALNADCAILDEKVTAVTKQLDEKVIVVSRQLRKRRPSPRSNCRPERTSGTCSAQQELDSKRVLDRWKEGSIWS